MTSEVSFLESSAFFLFVTYLTYMAVYYKHKFIIIVTLLFDIYVSLL